MARERGLTVGSTDYTGYPMADIIRHLKDWRDNTRKTHDALVKLQKQAEQNKGKLENADAVIAYCEHFIDIFDRYAGDFDRLIDELPKGVRTRHLEILGQLFDNSREQSRASIDFKNDWVYKGLPHEDMRPMLDSIYEESRSMMDDYLDLGNLHRRLKTFVDDPVT
jgi:hypothetical protein